MKRNLSIALLLLATTLHAQQEKFDIATFTPPQGWIRTESNGTLSFFDSNTENGLTRFCQIILCPGNSCKTAAGKNFNTAWQNLVTAKTEAKVKPVIQTQQTPDGWTVITGTANVRKEGISYKTILVNLTGFNKTISVQVNTAGGDYSKTLETFFENYNIDKNATNGNNAGTVNAGNSSVTLNDYDFVAPEKWAVKKNTDHLSFINPRSGCSIKILVPQPSSGNPEQDANAAFELMYKGWSYQNTGSRKFTLVKGVLPKGQEYFVKEAAMSGTNTEGQYNLEEGAAMVVKAGAQIVIISIRHNSGMLGHDECYKNYNTCSRFINSFNIRNRPATQNPQQENSQRIIGLWKLNTVGIAIGDYAFAANGHYQFGGGLGSSTTTSDMYYKYIYNKAYPFEGDGSYAVSDNLLTIKRRGALNSEQVTIRFAKVNHGGEGWKERMYMLKKDSYGENESVWEKESK